jgi:hypothetical protein
MIDAIVDENQTVSADGSQIAVTGVAIQYDSSVDRAALHHLNDNLVASPNGKLVAIAKSIEKQNCAWRKPIRDAPL